MCIQMKWQKHTQVLKVWSRMKALAKCLRTQRRWKIFLTLLGFLAFPAAASDAKAFPAHRLWSPLEDRRSGLSSAARRWSGRFRTGFPEESRIDSSAGSDPRELAEVESVPLMVALLVSRWLGSMAAAFWLALPPALLPLMALCTMATLTAPADNLTSSSASFLLWGALLPLAGTDLFYQIKEEMLKEKPELLHAIHFKAVFLNWWSLWTHILFLIMKSNLFHRSKNAGPISIMSRK